MSISDELKEFYLSKGFSGDIDTKARSVPVYMGCMLVPLPNIETRHTFLRYHDMHHMVTGYSVGRIEEGEMSAWELGTGSFWTSPLVGIMNVIALSTGIFLRPKRIWKAFQSGRKSNNLYAMSMRKKVDSNTWLTVQEMGRDILHVRSDRFSIANLPWFTVYALLSFIIHGLVVLPALALRFIRTTLLRNADSFRSVKHADLY